MSITVNIYYTGENSSARKFAEEMISGGTVEEIRNENGNIRYDYFYPTDDEIPEHERRKVLCGTEKRKR